MATRSEWVPPQILDRLAAVGKVTVIEASKGAQQIRFPSKWQLLKGEFRFLLRLLALPSAYRREQVLVAFGGHYGALTFAMLPRILRRHPHIALCNFYLHEMGNRR